MIFSARTPSNLLSKNVVEYLSERFTYFNAEEWAGRVIDGKISINGICCSVTDTIKAADLLTYDAGEIKEPAADLNYSIIYEDEWIIGVNKPGNLLVHRAGKSFRNNLIYHLRNLHDPSFPDADSVHRLDRETSGVLLVAKSRDAKICFAKEFAEGRIKKTYRAIVHGRINQSSFRIDKPLIKDESSAISYKFKTGESGKAAITLITEVTPLGRSASLLTIEPRTGRTHQIRVHLAALGHPVMGDKLYSLSEQRYIEWRDNPVSGCDGLEISRQALHCESLHFTHPCTGEIIAVVAAIAPDMVKLWNRLEGLE